MTTKTVDLGELEQIAQDAVRDHENWYRVDDLIDDHKLHNDDA